MYNVLIRPQIFVAQLQGPLCANNAIEVQAELRSAVLSEQTASLVVDMAQVDTIDNNGVMALVSIMTMAQRLNKPFTICSVARPVEMVLELTQLDRVLKIVETAPALEMAA